MHNEHTSPVEAAAEKLLLECLANTAKLYEDKVIVRTVREAAEMGDDGAENFDGWLPLRLAGSSNYYDYTLSELKAIRDVARTTTDTNEVARNIQLHRRNFIIGRGIRIDIYAEDLGDDPQKLAAAKEDAQVRKMKSNWKQFCDTNTFTERLWEWCNRADRDGEVYLRLFDDTIPKIRFVDPDYIESDDTDKPFGIIYDEADAETPAAIAYKSPVTDTDEEIPAEDMIIDKRNVDMVAPRGISSFWPVLANLRRLEKILVNSSVLATVQAAITMVRKHDTATAPRVQNFIRGQSDGINRTDSNGKTIYARKVRPGTVLDAPKGTSYEFPSHNVDASSFVKIAEHELGHIAAAFVLPVEWLLTTEPTEPLTPGSPVVANFEVEQQRMFNKVAEVFWKVQNMMGVNTERNKIKYTLYFNGKRLAVGKALDEARVDEILTRVGGTSPQEIAAKNGNNWTISRANVIKHRATKQPGEAMPGDAGNTNPASQIDNGGDGNTKKTPTGTTSRTAAGDGGTSK